MTAWQVYIIRCADGSLYTGITTDCQRRLRQHAGGRGARYLRGRGPLRLVYLEGGHDRSSAGRREWAIKAMCRAAKERLLHGKDNEIDDFPKTGGEEPGWGAQTPKGERDSHG